METNYMAVTIYEKNGKAIARVMHYRRMDVCRARFYSVQPLNDQELAAIKADLHQQNNNLPLSTKMELQSINQFERSVTLVRMGDKGNVVEIAEG
jgi:hypothetical protein